jgi:hypothetical protein
MRVPGKQVCQKNFVIAGSLAMKLQAPRNDKGKGTADIWREQLRPTITTSTEKGTKATD